MVGVMDAPGYRNHEGKEVFTQGSRAIEGRVGVTYFLALPNVGSWLIADIQPITSQRLLPARKRTSAARKSQWRSLMSGYRSKADAARLRC